MHIKNLLAITAVIAFFISSCNRRSVSLDETTAKGEVPQLGNLVFRFDRALVPDSMLNRWDSSEYVSFEPHIPGRFRWEGPEELVFSPARPLSPATTYQASLKNDLFAHSAFDAVEGDDELHFHTAPLQLLNTIVTWVMVDAASRTAQPQLQLLFNYPVQPAMLQSKLKLTAGGKKTGFDLVQLAEGSRMVLRLPEIKPLNGNQELMLTIEEGLVPVGGKDRTKEPLKTEVVIPSAYVLNIGTVEAEHDGTEGRVRIYTSQQLNKQDLAALVRFRPAVKFAATYDEYGMVLRSADFKAESAYSFTIQKGLRGVVGGTLPENYEGSVAFGDLEAGIRFTNNKAVYLSKMGSGNLEVQITNIPRVKLIISRIYENNLLMAQSNGYYPSDRSGARYVSDEEEDYYTEMPSVTAGDIIYSKEIDTRTLPRSAAGRLLNLKQFEHLLPDAKGIYHISIRSEKDYWRQDSRFISLSDLGLIAKQGTDHMYVFANSLKTAGSIDGVTINVYGGNNQLLGTGSTNRDGFAAIRIQHRDLAGFRPAMVIAKTSDDFNFLPFSNTRVNTSRFDVGGRQANATGLEAFIYAPRDIYRPGETLHYSVLLRDRKWKSPGELPVKVRFLLPNGKEWKLFRKGLNEQGATEGSVAIGTAAITGSYLMELYSANDVLLASRNFMIEEFVPDRIRVTAKLDKTKVQPSGELALQINAQNFFGPPAANRNFETEIQVRQKRFTAKDFADFDFTLTNQQSFFDKTVREGTTDAAGNAGIRYQVPQFYANNGLLQANFYTTVFDETGRPVSRHTAAEIFTQPVFFGIKDDGSYYYSLNQPVRIQLAAVNSEGTGVPATASVKVIKHEYRTVLTRSGSYFRYDSQKELKVLESNNASFSGRGSYTFIPRTPGDYEIRVAQPGGHTYVSKSFYSYGSWGENSSFEVNTDGEIDMSLDKEKYRSGETAKVLFKTPFSGRMLVTLEQEGVLSHQYLDVPNRSASLDIKLSSAHVPNVYVTATLFKPHEISGIPLTVAHGFQSIPVEEKGRSIALQITAEKKVRSRTKQQVRVKAIPGSYVTLAAVDNGVLQVSGFETPDPYDHFYKKQALGVTAYDVYPLLFPEVAARFSSTGGDANIEMEKRVNPMPAKRIKIMSYWSGIKKTGADGAAVFEFDIPQFSGELRLMAVAYKDEKLGAAEAKMTVADPIVLSSGLPRFLSPGDTAIVPVNISNTTSKATTAKAVLTVSGPLQISGPVTQQANIPAGGEGKALFKVVAAPVLGSADIKINVSALGETFVEETEIGIRPAVPLQKRTGGGSIAGGRVQKIDLPVADLLSGTVNYELVVSTDPMAELAGQLKNLLQYPFGCTEQVISSAFPQLYVGDFAERAGLQADAAKNANSNVLEAIRRIKLRQLYNGALTLWDGEGQEDWWTTVYAAHFLIEAKKAGFEVDPSLLETLLGYISSRLQTRQTITYYYNRDQQKKIAPKEVPYSLYVLSLANRSPVSAMNYYKANDELLALDGRYLLSAAYALSGDKRSAVNFLPRSFSGEYSVQQTGGSFYSALRDEAIALNALLEMEPAHPQIPVMSGHLRDQLKSNAYMNTQERSFAFLALGKMARAAGASNVSAEVRSGGKKIADVRGNWKGDKKLLKGGAVEIVTTGSGRIYYSWMAEGISNTGQYHQEDNYLKVRRLFYDRNGNLVSGNSFKQNELVIVGITLERAFNTDVENIVITDLLPAGFEIENPRTKELPGMDWIRDGATPTALDVRDDRIHLFVDLHNARQTYYYAVRAVTTGIFRLGPVAADAMYKPEYHSYHGAGWIRVAR